MPPTLVLATDTFDSFMAENGLHDFAISCNDDNEIVQRFLSARLPASLIDSLLILLAGYTFYAAYQHDRVENMAYAALNVALACYAVKAFIGLRNSVVDVCIHTTSLLYKPTQPRRRPRRDGAALARFLSRVGALKKTLVTTTLPAIGKCPTAIALRPRDLDNRFRVGG